MKETPHLLLIPEEVEIPESILQNKVVILQKPLVPEFLVEEINKAIRKAG